VLGYIYIYTHTHTRYHAKAGAPRIGTTSPLSIPSITDFFFFEGNPRQKQATKQCADGLRLTPDTVQGKTTDDNNNPA